MNTTMLLLTAFALAMDAFAVSVSCGVSQRAKTTRKKLEMALYFGVFQGIMPIFGFYLAGSFLGFLEAIDHYIAFLLLLIIGGHMVYEAFQGEACETKPLGHKQLIGLAIATSIDAFATGIGFALLHIEIFFVAAVIAVITFVTSLFGSFFGCRLGHRFEMGAEVFGGVILIGIAFKILIENMV
ncbi:MAG TPA: hypothetical protein DHN33_01300 [Eubacteriaceae bacterium]|nr:hypothetical protein [Eubacteriaceae bacterium]